MHKTSYITPSCLALGVHFHNTYQSKLAVEVLHAAGFSSSYSIVGNYEHVGAWLSGSELQNLNIPLRSFLQFMCDNADHSTRTLTCHGTFHGMATVISSSKPLNMSTVIPHMKVTTKDILEIGKIDITSFYSDGVLGPNIKNSTLPTGTLQPWGHHAPLPCLCEGIKVWRDKSLLGNFGVKQKKNPMFSML